MDLGSDPVDIGWKNSKNGIQCRFRGGNTLWILEVFRVVAFIGCYSTRLVFA